MMKRLLGSLLLAALMMLPGIGSAGQPAPTATDTEAPFTMGRWQIITEGPVGSGDGLYLLDFFNDGRVQVELQNSDRNVIDQKRWSMQDGALFIHTQPGDAIQEFIDQPIRLVDADTMRLTVEGGEVNMTKHYALASWVHLISFFIGSILVYELARKSKLFMIALFAVAPVALLPYWLDSGIDAWFKWAKLYSPIVHGLFFILMSCTQMFRKNWVRFTIAALFIINILEAVGQDFSIGHLPNILNGLAGIFCVLAVTRWAGINPDDSKEKDVLWPGMTLSFILVYDMWNITFVYLSFPDLTSIQIAVLAAATLPAIFIKKGTWMQARIFTLSIFMMYGFSFKTFVEVHTVATPRTDGLMLAVAAFSFAVNLAYLLYYWRWKYLGKAPKRVEVGQHEVAY
ncbi:MULTISPECIES: DUF5692 family protein [Ferrimonas]|uniref:DUF5692 family protein n=1 Tax=Ferrimonas TaxID=44011 RepID=UPI000421C930|nr:MULTISPECIES: DUF5692 family protein [Ferrimonas]USD36076.1 hypothetical protein J8Z22_13635 [Ferrimonas sp. SCSIO 43195]